MRRLLQNTLLAAYRIVFARGLLRYAWGKRLFFTLYDLYKDRLEAGAIAGLQRWVPAGGLVVDVGANVGFFTLRFADWVGASGRVVALEPEQRNHEELIRRVRERGWTDRVTIERAVADRVEGEVLIEINPDHPGDHKLGRKGIPVAARTVDAICAEIGGPVSLVKIDVQGAEMRVLEGARRVLADRQSAMFIEVDPSALSRFGTSTAEVIDLLAGYGYRPHVLENFGAAPVTREILEARIARNGYTDVLFLADRSVPTENGVKA